MKKEDASKGGICVEEILMYSFKHKSSLNIYAYVFSPSLANDIMFYILCYTFLHLFIRRPFHVAYSSASFCYLSYVYHIHTSLLTCSNTHDTLLCSPQGCRAKCGGGGQGNFHWSWTECLTKLLINMCLRVNKDMPIWLTQNDLCGRNAKESIDHASFLLFSIHIFLQPSSSLWYHHQLCPWHLPYYGPINFLWTTCDELFIWIT